MLYYQVHNISENTRTGKSLYGDVIKLNPNGQDGDTRWMAADDLVRLVGLTEGGMIDQTYIEILGAADIGDSAYLEEIMNCTCGASGTEINISYESIEPILENLINIMGDVNSLMSANLPIVDRATGSAAIAYTLAPGAAFRLECIKIHLSDVGSAGDLTITQDAGAGAAYDNNLLTQTMTTVRDILYNPARAIPYAADDEIDIAWANGSSRTYGIEVWYTLV